MTSLTGTNLIAGRDSALGKDTYTGIDPVRGESLQPAFANATESEIDGACEAAFDAFRKERRRPKEERAALLEMIAEEIEQLGDVLTNRVMAETALPEARVRGERGRTTNQLRMFANLIREGRWADVRIERREPDRQPLPKPDLRRMLIPLGPVAVFGASNFPLAFSVAGGDTASALAAGCPVVVKAHPSHPGTSELVGRAIQRAVERAGFHPGTFSLVHGVDPEVSLALVRHPRIRAVGFTGSLRAGRALYDAAAARPEPIPVHAEMGSVNPLFVLPSALATRSEELVRGLLGSVTLGAGQFCTNPGLVFVIDGPDADAFIDHLGSAVAETPAFTMLNRGICTGFARGVEEFSTVQGVEVAGRSGAEGGGSAPATAVVFTTDLSTYRATPRLHEELFGPATLVVRCPDAEAMIEAAERLEGNLTATIQGSEDELLTHAALIDALEDRAGRLIFNGFPTGVEVSPAMQHGGPYPASTDARTTSVGTAAIYRFARPVCYQDFPVHALREELRA